MIAMMKEREREIQKSRQTYTFSPVQWVEDNTKSSGKLVVTACEVFASHLQTLKLEAPKGRAGLPGRGAGLALEMGIGCMARAPVNWLPPAPGHAIPAQRRQGHIHLDLWLRGVTLTIQQ